MNIIDLMSNKLVRNTPGGVRYTSSRQKAQTYYVGEDEFYAISRSVWDIPGLDYRDDFLTYYRVPIVMVNLKNYFHVVYDGEFV